jgi:hypothetical protein
MYQYLFQYHARIDWFNLLFLKSKYYILIIAVYFPTAALSWLQTRWTNLKQGGRLQMVGTIFYGPVHWLLINEWGLSHRMEHIVYQRWEEKEAYLEIRKNFKLRMA